MYSNTVEECFYAKRDVSTLPFTGDHVMSSDSATPSAKNPSLVVFVVDNSRSMIDSGQHKHIMDTLVELRSIANGKPKTIKFVLISFAETPVIEYWGYLEDLPFRSTLYESDERQTNLKAAARKTKEVVEVHISECDAENPTVSVLFFTDGGHSPPLEPGISIDEYLDFKPNVTCGMINYTAQENFPSKLTTLPYHLTKVTKLTAEYLRKAYDREENNPVNPNRSLKTVFGEWEDLVGKLFMIGSETVNSNPEVTAAFVKLGSFSSMVSDLDGTIIDISENLPSFRDLSAGWR